MLDVVRSSRRPFLSSKARKYVRTPPASLVPHAAEWRHPRSSLTPQGPRGPMPRRSKAQQEAVNYVHWCASITISYQVVVIQLLLPTLGRTAPPFSPRSRREGDPSFPKQISWTRSLRSILANGSWGVSPDGVCSQKQWLPRAIILHRNTECVGILRLLKACDPQT